MKNSKSITSVFSITNPLTTLFNLLAGVFVVFAYLTNMELPQRNIFLGLLTALVLMGLIYNIAFWNKIREDAPLTVRYIQFLFIVVEIGIIVFFTQGISSIWYSSFLIIIVGSSILGLKAYYMNIGLITIFYVIYIISTLNAPASNQLSFDSFPQTIAALIFAGLVAYITDKYQYSTEEHKKVSSQLTTAKLTEGIMLGSIIDAVIGINMNEKIVLMNEAAQNFSGWAMDDAIDINFFQVFKLKDSTDKEIDDKNDPFRLVFQNNRALRTDDYYLLDRNNQKISLSMSISPISNTDNELAGAIAVIRDISEQKKLERERNEFVSTASHEMRTPVAAIEGYISMAQNPNLAQVDDKAKQFLQKAHDSAIHLGKLFQDLLSVSKIEDRNLKTERVVFNLSDVVLKAAADMQILARQKGIKLTTHIGGAGIRNQLVVAPTYPIKADPERIMEVMNNLIDNAIKYTNEGYVDVEIISDSKFVTVKVHDTGVGIPVTEQKHLFEKFYRVNSSLTRDKPGTGLGLYIARNLIELYGGTMWVESKANEGSTFCYKLPLFRN